MVKEWDKVRGEDNGIRLENGIRGRECEEGGRMG
jgi:hypothetical protein